MSTTLPHMPHARGPRSSSPFGSRILGPADQSAKSLRRRVQIILTALLVSTNVVASMLVLVTSAFVLPAPAPSQATWVALAIAIPTYVGLATIIGATFGTAATLRALRWATAGTEPTDADRRRALMVPAHLTLLQGLTWLIGSIVFGTLALILQPERAFSTTLTVLIAGFVVCGLGFLLSEWTLRPVAARALAGEGEKLQARGASVGSRMVIFWAVGTGAPVMGLLVGSIYSLAKPDLSRTQLSVTTLVLCSVVLVFGLYITILNARSVVAPLEAVREAQKAVEAGDLDQSVIIYDGTEIGSLQAGFNSMAAGLRERETLRDLFGRHVGREVAAAAADQGDVELGGTSLTVTVLFIDLVGSTTYATEHSPTDVVAVLNRFFGVVVDEVDHRHGLVNKFIGDAVLAIFGAPVALADHSTAALSAARAMAERLAVEVPEIGAGIGVATGEVVAGNVGHESRFEYTVIGDAVNSAARLTDLAKDRPTRVLASWPTIEAASQDEAAHWERSGEAVLRGRTNPTPLAEPRTAASAHAG